MDVEGKDWVWNLSMKRIWREIEYLVFGKRMCVGVIEGEDQRMTFTVGTEKKTRVEKLMTIPRVSFVWPPVPVAPNLSRINPRVLGSGTLINPEVPLPHPQ